MIVQQMISNSTIANYQYNITPKTKEILIALVKQNNYLSRVETSLQQIIKDDKLDASDVPIIMLLLSDLYQCIQTLSIKDISTTMCGEIIKILVESAVLGKIITVSENDTVLISSIFGIIDTSIHLIQTKNILDETSEILEEVKGCLC